MSPQRLYNVVLAMTEGAKLVRVKTQDLILVFLIFGGRVENSGDRQVDKSKIPMISRISELLFCPRCKYIIIPSFRLVFFRLNSSFLNSNHFTMQPAQYRRHCSGTYKGLSHTFQGLNQMMLPFGIQL